MTIVEIRIIIVLTLMAVYAAYNFSFTDSDKKDFDVRYLACDGDFVVAGLYFIGSCVYVGLFIVAVLNIIFFYV